MRWGVLYSLHKIFILSAISVVTKCGRPSFKLFCLEYARNGVLKRWIVRTFWFEFNSKVVILCFEFTPQLLQLDFWPLRPI